MPEFDDSHQPVLSVDFDFDEAGRALGDLDSEKDALAKVVEAFASIPTTILRMASDGLPKPRTERDRARRNRSIAMRTVGLRYVLGDCELHGMTVKDVASKESFCYWDLTREVKWARKAIGAHRMLRNLTGTRAK